MKIAIIGMPQTGKKTLFELITGHKPTENEVSSGRPIKGIAEVKDPRFDKLVGIYKPKKAARARIEAEVFPKIEKDSMSQGDIYKDLDKADAICHVVRAFKDESIYHILGDVDPKRDIEFVNSEIILHDLIFIEKRLEKIEKETKRAPNPVALKEKEILLKIKANLDKELPARTVELSAEERKIISGYPFITGKKLLLALNVSEDDLKGRELLLALEKDPKLSDIEIMQVCVKAECEIAQLESNDEKAEFLKAIGIEEPAVDVLSRMCMKALNLISFFTVGTDEVKQWTVKKNASAPEAAGAIHTDIEKGFIRAELIKYNDLISAGSEEKLKAEGKSYLKGKDYITEDGDIMNFRFNV